MDVTVIEDNLEKIYERIFDGSLHTVGRIVNYRIKAFLIKGKYVIYGDMEKERLSLLVDNSLFFSTKEEWGEIQAKAYNELFGTKFLGKYFESWEEGKVAPNVPNP